MARRPNWRRWKRAWPCATYCAEQHAGAEGRWASGSGWPGTISAAPRRRQNHELTLHFARALWKNGYLEVRTTKQVYSNADKRFLPDRYVDRHLSALRL